jgi:hypothetical protein
VQFPVDQGATAVCGDVGGARPEQPARDHGAYRATACRYIGEGAGVLADQAPDLREALSGPGTRTRNSLLRCLRFQGERGFALLTQRWVLFQHITASPRGITQIVCGALIFTRFEHKYIRRNSLRSLQ